MMISQSCHAVQFFGVPNNGLEVASLISMVKGQPNSNLIADLKGGSQFLRLLDMFWEGFKVRDTRVVSINETKPTPTVQLSRQSFGVAGCHLYRLKYRRH